MADDEFEALLRPQNGQTITTSTGPQHDDRRAHRRASIGVVVTLFVLLGGLVGGGFWAWGEYGETVQKFFVTPEIPDFEGPGKDPEILITVEPGDIGEVVARRLFNEGVTASFESVYNILLADSSIVFQPGTYRLLSEMSAAGAIEALRNSANRAEYRFVIIEGIRVPDALARIAENTSISLADLEAAVADPTRYGIDPPTGTLEGYLAPATYTFEWGTDAETVIQKLVDTTTRRLEEAGVQRDDWHRVLTIASIIEREAKLDEDFYKVSRVIANRLAPGSKVPLLQMDSTITYWEQTFSTVWTSDAERANDDNPYNTYRFPGLPPGPIALPGPRAIDATLNPAEGPWLYFVTWNMATGETFFSTTFAEHERLIALGKECRDNEDKRDQCRNLQ
jgi:UPF0755 protein